MRVIHPACPSGEVCALRQIVAQSARLGSGANGDCWRELRQLDGGERSVDQTHEKAEEQQHTAAPNKQHDVKADREDREPRRAVRRTDAELNRTGDHKGPADG